jgi:glycosyltransferase involved in cell wall biosynthesis
VCYKNFESLNTINRFSIYQTIKGMKFDLFFQLSPLAEPGLTWVSPDFLYDSIPSYSIFYDGISPEKNMHDDDFQLLRFQERVQYLSSVDGYLSISKKSDEELRLLMNKDICSIVVGGGPTLGSTQHLQVPSNNEYLSFFFPGAGDPRKGAETLVEAVRLSASTILNETKFVLSGMENEFGQKIVLMAQDYGIQNYFEFYGTLSDNELKENYLASTAVIFPSRREGLGLPVLDAQSIGKPCLISQTQELLEISYDDVFSFKVDDSAHLAEIIQLFVNDQGFRDERIAIAQESRALTEQMWVNVSKTSFEFFKLSIDKFRNEKKNLENCYSENVFVTPLPPEQTGIADRNAALLPALRKHLNIAQRHGFDAFIDVLIANNVVLTLGNSPHNIPAFVCIPFCNPIFDVHDSSLDRFFETLPYESLGTTLANYILFNFGIDYLVEMKSATEIGIPLGKKILGSLINTNKAIITHNASAQTFLESEYQIPLWERGFKLKPKGDTNFNKSFVVSSFGFIDKSKQLDLLIEMLAESTFRDRIDLYVVGSGDADLISKLRDIAKESNLKVTFTGYVSSDRYAEILAKTDVAIQLRSSERLETPGSVLDCLESNVPTISNSKIAFNQFIDSPFFIYADSLSDIQEAMQRIFNGEFTDSDSEKNYEGIQNSRLSSAVVDYCDILESNLISYPYLTNQKCFEIVTTLAALESPLMYLKNFALASEKKRVFLVLTDEVSKSSVDGILRVAMNLYQDFVEFPNVVLVPIIRRKDLFFVADDLGLIDSSFREISQRFQISELPVQPEESDLVVFPGMDGGLHEAQKVLEFWKNRGTRIVSIVHDVLQLTNPE